MAPPGRPFRWLGFAVPVPLIAALLSVPLLASDPGERGKLRLTSVPIRAEEAIRRMFAIALDARGRVFAANGDLLVYDGYRTRKMPLPSSAPVGAVAVDTFDRVWTGTSGDLGYFSPQPTGDWAYTSIYAHLPPDARAYDKVWEIHCLGETVFFVTSQHLLVWREGKFTVHSLPNQRRLFASSAAGRCFVWQRQWMLPQGYGEAISTLWRFDSSGRGEATPGIGPGLYPVRVLAETATGTDLVINDTRRAHLSAGNLSVGPFALSGNDATAVITADLMPDSDALMGTNGRGIIRVTREGKIRWHANVTTRELPDTAIEALALDRNARAWVIAPNSLYAIDTTGLVTTWPAADGWPSAIHCIARVDGTLYIGDALGQHQLAPGKNGSPATWITRLPKETRVAYSYLTSPRLRFVTAGISHNYISSGFGQELSPDASATGRSVLHLANDDGILIFADMKGLAAFQAPTTQPAPDDSPQWPKVWERSFPSLDRAYAGAGGELFVTDSVGEITLFRFARTAGKLTETAPPQRCTPPGGLGRVVHAQQWDGCFYAFTRQGLWAKRPTEPGFARVPSDAPGAIIPFSFTRGSDGATWATAEIRAPWRDLAAPPIYGLFRVRFAADGSLHGFDAPPVAVIDNIGLLTAQFRDPDVWWLGGAEGIARVDFVQLETRTPVRLLDRPYFTAATGENGEPLALAAPVALRDARRLRIEFAFSRHLHPLPTTLESRLSPAESAWTRHADEARWRDFANLPAGHYELEVRAVDLTGQTSPTIAWSFAVAPRFSETGWYRAALGAAVLLAFAAGASIWTWRLRRRRDELARQVAERTTALVEANQELHRLNSRRVEFIGAVSHEVRTPLLGAALLARRQAGLPEASTEARHLSRCLDDLQAMLEGTMDLSRYELGLIPVRLGWAPLSEILPGISSVFRPLAETKGLRFEASATVPPDRSALVDLSNFRRIAHNLISNAVKFTATGDIAVHFALLPADANTEEQLELIVSDTGIGMAPDQVSRLFTDFQRSAWQSQTSHGSHGLGLTLTKRLVDLVGGSIACESREGQGTRFVVRLPVVSGPIGTEEPPFAFDALLLEDEHSHAEHAQDILEPLGATVRRFERLADLDALPPPPAPDLVLLDFNLPDGTGLDALARLQSVWGRGPRWILISAIHSDPMVGMCLAAGFDAVLSKPLSVGAALRQVRALGRRAENAPRSDHAGPSNQFRPSES